MSWDKEQKLKRLAKNERNRVFRQEIHADHLRMTNKDKIVKIRAWYAEMEKKVAADKKKNPAKYED